MTWTLGSKMSQAAQAFVQLVICIPYTSAMPFPSFLCLPLILHLQTSVEVFLQVKQQQSDAKTKLPCLVQP